MIIFCMHILLMLKRGGINNKLYKNAFNFVISYNKSLIKYIKCIKIHFIHWMLLQMPTSLITTKLLMVDWGEMCYLVSWIKAYELTYLLDEWCFQCLLWLCHQQGATLLGILCDTSARRILRLHTETQHMSLSWDFSHPHLGDTTSIPDSRMFRKP